MACVAAHAISRPAARTFILLFFIVPSPVASVSWHYLGPAWILRRPPRRCTLAFSLLDRTKIIIEAISVINGTKTVIPVLVDDMPAGVKPAVIR